MMKNESLKEHYTLVSDPNDADSEYWCVKLLKGDFAGVVYKYGELGFAKEPNVDGTLTTKFEYDIINVPNSLEGKEFSDEEGEAMELLLGDILIEIITDDLDKRKEDVNGGPIGEDDSEGVNVRRSIYPESDPFFKD